MKIVITGANGTTGAALCQYFSRLGHEVIATGRQPKASEELLKYATYICADITKPLPVFDAEVCIHAAAQASDTADYDSLFLNNVTGTANVLEAAINCRYIVFISSSSVYDFTDKPALEEDTTQNIPPTDYGKTKLLAEELVSKNIPPKQHRIILRPRAIYGIGDRVLLPRLLSLLKGRIVFYPSKKNVLTSATQVDNIAYAINLFLNQPDKPPLQVYNIADDAVYSLRDLTLGILSAVTQKNLKHIAIPLPVLKLLSLISPKKVSALVLKTFMQNSVLDIAKIKTGLGYAPQNNFNNKCEEIAAWIKRIGGKKAYLDHITQTPWMLNDPNKTDR